MFHRHGKKGSALNAKPLKDLIRIVTADHLLADEKRSSLLLQIREACALEAPRFDSLGLTVLHNLINHCQSLPDTSHSYYSQQGGLLDHALNRTEAALNLFKQYLIADEHSEFSEDQKLWQYALLTAALLQGIGKLQIDYLVSLYDNNGQFLKEWNPLLENLALVGSHYAYSFQKESDPECRRRLNILLARLLMPLSGFSWIASNPKVLAVWLALLNEDPYAAGTLGAILIRADAIAIQRYFNQQSARSYGSRGGRYGRVSTFAGGNPDVSEIEQEVGIEFLQWLYKSFESGAIIVNKAPLLMVPGGLLMSAEIFQLFIRENPDYKNWQAVQNGFLSLGLHATDAEGNINGRFEQNNNQQMHTGVVFANFAVALPPAAQVHNLHTGKSIPMSATEIIHLSQFNNYFTRKQQNMTLNSLQGLNASGQWQEINGATTPNPSKPGVKSGV
ncbi:MAG: TraI domain-containing protein [Legionella sp.]|nr:TraI domain-containing protein [Legionella sp.]